MARYGTAAGLLLLFAGGCVPAPPPSPPPADALAEARDRLLDELREQGVSDARVLDAMARVPREEFVLPADRHLAYVNHAMAIGHGQTISQPLIVGLMTQLLGLTGGERVLEVGTGSGYQAAVLSVLVGEVYSIEIDPTLAESARQRLEQLGYNNVHVRAGDGFFGWEEAAPFDAILITARAPQIPPRLLAQLKPDGVIVMPLEERGGETLIRARRDSEGVQIERFGSVAFVPMRGAVRSPADGTPSQERSPSDR